VLQKGKVESTLTLYRIWLEKNDVYITFKY